MVWNEKEIDANYIKKLLDTKDIAEIKKIFSSINEMDAAELLSDLPLEKSLIIFRILPKDIAALIFAELDSSVQHDFIKMATDKEIAAIIEELMIDDAVDTLEEMPASMVQRILSNVSAETRKTINQFLTYPDNSVGSVMTAELMGIKKNMTVSEAIKKIRQVANQVEQIYSCYVMDNYRVLEGVVSIKELLMSNDDEIVENIMDKNVISVSTLDDQEEAAKLVKKYDLLSIPVVDKEQRLVGIVTVDDIIDVIEKENTEDISKMAGVHPSDDEYLSASVFTLAKNRVTWLVFLMVSSILASFVLTKQQAVFAVMPILVAFIPMLTDAGGNAGSQTASIIIRSMVIGEIENKSFLRVLFKELRVATLVALVMAIFNFGITYIQYREAMLSVAVAISLFFTIISAKMVGCCLPFFAKLVHLDPALMAAPLISTIMDMFSLIVYFSICRVIFGI